MITEKETVKCEAIFNEERTHRYLWRRVWSKDKPCACVVMINPCVADCLIMDTTTYLVVNNIARLEDFGGVEIVNLYSKITNKLELRWNSDEDLTDGSNNSYIKKSAAECDTVILAWGTGVLNNKRVLGRINDVLEQLKPFSKKLHVITDGDEVRAVHPLAPAVRNQWILETFEPKDIQPAEKAPTKRKSPAKAEENATTAETTADVAEPMPPSEEETTYENTEARGEEC